MKITQFIFFFLFVVISPLAVFATSNSVSCSLPVAVNSGINASIQKYRALSVPQAKAKIGNLLSVVATLRSSGKYSDILPLCYLDTIESRFFSLNNELGTGSLDLVSSGNIQGNWPFGDTDPGSGLWIPKGSTNLYVVDRSASLTTNHFPGAINGGSPSPGSETYNADYYRGSNGKIVSFHPGTIISVRVRSKDVLPVMGSVVRLAGWHGDNLGGKWRLSISTIPGDFSTPICSNSGSNQGSLMFGDIPINLIGTNPCNSSILPSTNYYINIKAIDSPTNKVTAYDDNGVTRYKHALLPDPANANCVDYYIQCPNIYVIISSNFAVPFVHTGNNNQSCSSGTCSTVFVQTGTTNNPSVPAFPWYRAGKKVMNEAELRLVDPYSCIDVNGIRALSGFGPCGSWSTISS